MSDKKGTISVNTENIFPIIKKWLYSEKDIFIREIISNSSDAINKLKKLATMGEFNLKDDEKFRIDVELDSKKKTIKITDNGIGMTEEEVVKYINQIAFSGALDFFEKYKDKTDNSQIIGHFGLGFYSAFMVSEKVEIDTLSYQEGAEPIHWVSEEGTEFEMGKSKKKTRGTTITLHLDKDNKEFLEEFKLKETIQKYFSFLSVELFFNGKEEPLNDTNPLWLKETKECTDEEYKEFYHKVFNDFNDPLFWIHLNMDYPFKLKGILYFPRMKHEYETIDGVVKLYNNQVFVADNVKEIIPEFLFLLKGVIDCPDLPLNVSRSYLQNDSYVKKISNHIIKKVSDKLKDIFKKDREQYEKYWDDINPFIKYGCLKEEKFYDRIKDILIAKDIYGQHVTIDEYISENREKNNNKIYYVTNLSQQAQYVNMFKENNMNAVILDTMLDSHYMNFLESKLYDYDAAEDDKKEDKDKKDDKKEPIHFARIDSEITDVLKDTENEEDEKTLSDLNEAYESLFKRVLNNENIKVKVERLKSETMPAVMLLSEQSRRIKEMSKMYGLPDDASNPEYGNMFKDDATLVLNRSNSLIESLESIREDETREDDVKLICEHIYDLALMAQQPLSPEEMTKFIERNTTLMHKII